MTKLVDIEEIGEVSAKKLQLAGIKTLEDFLTKAVSPRDRKAVAEKIGISETLNS